MTNFELLLEECENYRNNFILEDEDSKSVLIESGFSGELFWGMTPYESFLKVILSVRKPKRFVVFGCSIGYQCFIWNKLFPEIPCVGIDIMPYRVEWGKSMITKYQIRNVKLYNGNVYDFPIENGDLIWQNNLMFDDEIIDYSNHIFTTKDVEMVSYLQFFEKSNLLKSDYCEFPEKGGLKIIKEKKFQVKTSWTHLQDIYYYQKWIEDASYDVDFINSEFLIPESELKNYETMNFSKRLIKSENLKFLYNKYNNKMKFLEFGFNVPELYFYSKDKCNLSSILKNLKTFVAKPAHFSESVDVFVKSNINQEVDYDLINSKLNDRIEISDKGNWRKSPIGMNIDWKDTERGIIVEEYIKVVYELKVFVVFGEPFIVDLRKGFSELYTIDFIKKENSYLNWNKEYEIIKEFSKSLKIDFFRIDFLYDGNKLYASELTFMPATFLPVEIQELIGNRLRMPYLKYYYPQFC